MKKYTVTSNNNYTFVNSYEGEYGNITIFSFKNGGHKIEGTFSTLKEVEDFLLKKNNENNFINCFILENEEKFNYYFSKSLKEDEKEIARQIKDVEEKLEKLIEEKKNIKRKADQQHKQMKKKKKYYIRRNNVFLYDYLRKNERKI